MRRILTADVAKATADAKRLVNFSYSLEVEVQLIPRHIVFYGTPAYLRKRCVTLSIHPSREAVDHVVDDLESVVHSCSAHLHTGRAERDKLGGVAPIGDA